MTMLMQWIFPRLVEMMKGKTSQLLCKQNTDMTRQPTEYMPIQETYSPTIHRINQAIRHRAIHPDGKIEPPADVLMQWSNPPAELIEKSASELNALQKAADVKKGKLADFISFEHQLTRIPT